MFKRVEVVGASKEEALAKAPFETPDFKNATQKYNNWREKQTGAITDSDIKQFMHDYLAENTKFAPGVGCYIVLDAASKDTRKRPYVYESIKGEGTRKWKTFHVWRDDETGVEVCSVDTTKAKAAEAMKKMYSDKNYKGNVSCHLEKRVVEGSPVEAKMKYAPSKSAANGRYLCFGVESI